MFRFFCLFFILTPLLIAEQKPNILILIADDQRYDQVVAMPNTLKEIRDKGLSFSKAYITTPYCCPSRAAIYTGQYNSRNQVIGNNYSLSSKSNTIFKDFTKDYYVGLVGKYLNTHDGTPLPEFDYWAVYPFGSTNFFFQEFNVNGQIKKIENVHSSISTTKFTFEFLEKASEQNKPWFLVSAFFSPHRPARAMKIDEGRYKDYPVNIPPNFGPAKAGKPKYIYDQEIRTKEARIKKMRKQLDCSYSLDRQIGKIIKKLEETEQINNTLIIYLSDNGVFKGEHGLTSKGTPYEENIRVPLFVRYDQMIKTSDTYDHIIGNIDIAATLYDLANIKPKHKIDGLSFLPAIKGEKKAVRNELLIEAWKNNFKYRNSFYAVHTGKQVYIENKDDICEFYDLVQDPFQLKNLCSIYKEDKLLLDLKSRLHNLVQDTRGSLDFDLAHIQKSKVKDKD